MKVDADGCPVVAVVPFPVPGLTVMILRATDSLLSPQQEAIFRDSDVINWCRNNCHKVNGQPLYRHWDPSAYTDSDLSSFPRALRDAYKYGVGNATSDPWVVINDGENWTSQALPKNVTDMMTLLRSYE